MKQSIEWHKHCLQNRINSLTKVEEELKELEKRIKRSRQETALYKAQVALAQKEGKDAFDSECYGINRLCI